MLDYNREVLELRKRLTNKVKWCRILVMKTQEEIKQEFDKLALAFNNSMGFACYEIGQKLIKLSNEHFRLTGEYLQKPKRKK